MFTKLIELTPHVRKLRAELHGEVEYHEHYTTCIDKALSQPRTGTHLLNCHVRAIGKINQELAEARQEAATLRRQVEVLCRKLTSLAVLPSDTSSGLSPVQAWRAWAEQQAKEAK